MKATGIVRRIDDLGRVIIPKEIRKILGIREGDPLEIFIDHSENAVCFKPYLPFSEPWRLLEDVATIMRDSKDFQKYADDVHALASKIKEKESAQEEA